MTSTSSWFSALTRTASASASSAKPASLMPPGGGVASAPAPLSDGPPAAVGVRGGGGGGVVAAVAGAGGRRRQMQGTLFKYGPKSAQVAIKTGDFNHQVIFIGGLTDGFLATDYLEPLSLALEVEKWSLVQPLLSSSYTGYGISSLEQDALELDQLISYLINKENSEGVILLGHSTGCQDIVHYMRTNFACSKAVSGVILQAPVSDREYRATLPETAEMIDLAAKMINEGRAMDLMPREANPDAPITAYRFHSLCAYMGDDDMFSSDLSEDQLRQRLGHMSTTQCQVIFSMGDEYVPEYVDKQALVDRICRALGGAEKVEIEWGNHALSNRPQEAVRAIVDFVKREGPKGQGGGPLDAAVDNPREEEGVLSQAGARWWYRKAGDSSQ
uniref:AB hydrolase-1 domain-containing protein n=1 Tax=Leersia perrieri TaxID=77586 RepID=A0A0D9WWT3_9ORYZ